MSKNLGVLQHPQAPTCLRPCIIIQTSRSPWASPIVVITNKDGGTRLCIDYQQLNVVTLKDAYPLLHIADTLEALSGAKYFSTMDLSSGY